MNAGDWLRAPGPSRAWALGVVGLAVVDWLPNTAARGFAFVICLVLIFGFNTRTPTRPA